MKTHIGLAAAVVAGLLALHPGWVGAVHDADVTDDESKCQIGASQAQGKFITEKAKCVIRCNQGARKTPPLNPASDCAPPYAGATADCIQLAEDKAIAGEGTKCEKDCPECYQGGDCAADATMRTAGSESEVDTLVPLVYCNDSASGDGLTAEEAKCQDTTAKALSNFANKKLKCYSKCRKDEHKGKVPIGACDPPAPPDDPKATDCIQKNEDKAAKLIDKKCGATGGDAPECYGAIDGAGWVAVVETAVDNGQADLYCGSPSGAFLD